MKKTITAILSDLFRQKGYASLSMMEIAEATKLSKSSLYHHFPGGKVEMAEAVLTLAFNTLSEQFTLGLQHPTAKRQLNAILTTLNDFYSSGHQNCLVDVMSVIPSDPSIQVMLDKILKALIGVFTTILQNDGSNTKTAKEEAVKIVSLLQGSLVLARAGQNANYFIQTLKFIRQHYC